MGTRIATSLLSSCADDTQGNDAEGDADDALFESIEKVVVVDSSVELAKKLTNVGGLRLIGVWIGLDSLDKFESRLQSKIDEGSLKVPTDESDELP